MAARPSKRERLVYYAINDNPLYIAYVENSLAGLRRFNKKIPVKVSIFGKTPAAVKKRLAKLGAEVESHPSVVKSEELTFLKWFALPNTTHKGDVIFLDADTFVCADIEKLFNRYAETDFAARKEIGTRKGMRAKMMAGGYVVIPQLEEEAFVRVRKKLKCADRPVFNTGVMYFSEKGRRAILEKMDLFKLFKNDFMRNKVEYPCRTVHILEEIVFTLVLGRINGIKISEIQMKESPWYVEWKGKHTKSPGVVLHTWSHYYLFGLLDLYGMRAFRKAPFKGLVHPRYIPS